MKISEFNTLCATFGNPNDSIDDKWKAIKYIYNENAIVDVQKKLKENKIKYINDAKIGAGFYIVDYITNGVSVQQEKEGTISFIPLDIIDKISFITNYI